MNYLVSLQDAPSDLPERARVDAEKRFQRTLERALGGAEAVIPAYRAWQQAEESSDGELSAEDARLARQWLAAATRAYQDGFRDLGECEAYFDVRLAR